MKFQNHTEIVAVLLFSFRTYYNIFWLIRRVFLTCCTVFRILSWVSLSSAFPIYKRHVINSESKYFLTRLRETEKFFVSTSETFSPNSITLCMHFSSHSVTLSDDEASETHSSGFPRDVMQEYDDSTKASKAATQWGRFRTLRGVAFISWSETFFDDKIRGSLKGRP